MESQKGDRLYCIGEFYAMPDGMPFDWSGCHRFQVGEGVVFCGHRINDASPNHPSRYMVLFEATDGRLYSAVESYFVSDDTWNQLADHFSRRDVADRQPPANGVHAANGDVSRQVA
jgi:hypothetical protein